MNRHLLVFLDKYVFRIAFYAFVLLARLGRRRQVPFHPEPDEDSHFLVIRPGGLGDALMAVPFLKILRRSFPKGRITLVLQKKNQAALKNLPFFDELIVMDDPKSLFKNIFRILLTRFDIVLDLEPFRKVSSIVSYLSGAAIRVGFDTNSRRLLYTHHVTYANEKNYDSLNMTRQLKVIGIDADPREAVDIRCPLPESALRNAEKTFAANGLDWESDFVAAVAPGVLKPHHRWVMSRFASLIKYMLEEDPRTRVVLVGSRADREDAGEVMEHLRTHDRVLNLVGRTTFMDALGIFRLCRILVACDGGMVYMAASMGCSTISLWGPGVMERFKPPGEDHVGIRKNYFCVPCVNYSRLGEFPRCSYDRACIRDISASEVFYEYWRSKQRLLRGTDTPIEHIPLDPFKPHPLESLG